MDKLIVKDVVKVYGTKTVLDKVSVSIPEGSIYGLLGPNGAGKTTLIRIINQITAPDSGELIFKGKPLSRNDIGLIGYLPEERGLYKKMKVGECALYLARLKGLSRNDAMKRLKYWFEKFEIERWWNKKIEELSKGMQQKLQFVTTIIHNPEFLIFDEPFSGFDPINAELLKNEILELNQKGATVVFSTHNMASVEELCDNISLVNCSKVVLQGSVKDIRKQFKGNTFQMEVSGNVAAFKSKLVQIGCLIDTLEGDDVSCFASFQIPTSSSRNDVLTAIMPEFSIISFREVFPCMNDIFIKVVTSGENFSQNDLL